MSLPYRPPVVARTVKGFCQAYGVGVTTCYKLISEGKIEARKVSARKTLITESSAKSWFYGLDLPGPLSVPKTRARANDGAEPRTRPYHKSLQHKGKRATAKVGE